MDNKIVFEVTDRGADGLANHDALLFGDMKRALLMVDGESTFGEISKRAAPSLRAILPDLMKELQAGGFIQDKAKGGMAVRMVVPPRLVTPAQADLALKKSDSDGKSELDFTSSMPVPTPEMMAEEGARIQAEKTRLEAQASALAEAAALQAQQQAAAARLQAEQDAISLASQQAPASAAAPEQPPAASPARPTGIAAAGVVKQPEVSGVPVQPVGHTAQTAPLPADKVHLRQMRQEAEERAVLEAQTRLLAAAQAKLWADAELRAAGGAARALPQLVVPVTLPADAAGKPYRDIKVKRKLPLWAMLLAALPVLMLAVLFIVPLVLSEQKYAHQLEQILSVKFQQPVHVGHLAGRFLPTPRLVMGDVYIGEARQIKAQQAQVDFAMLSLLSKVSPIDSIELQGLQVSGAALPQMVVWLQLLAADEALPVKRMVIHQGVLDGGGVQLSGIEGDLDFAAQGVFARAHLAAGAGKYLLDLEGGASDKLKVALAVRDAALPLLPNWQFAELSAKGELSRDALSISEFAARIAGGMLNGSARIDWRAGWNAQGSLDAKAVDMQKISKQLEGNADGAARFRMEAETLADLTDSTIVEGGFAAKKGVILGMDIVGTASLHSKEHLPGGKTYFDELSGTFSFDDDSYHFRQMQVTTEVLDATAALDVAAGQLSGKINAKLKTHQSGLPVDLLIGGTTESPTLRAIR